MNVLIFLLLMSMLHIFALATPHNFRTRLRVKRADTNASKHEDRVGEEKTGTEAPNFDPSELDICNASVNSESYGERTRRSLQYSLDDLIATTTEVHSEALIDLSILSPEFLNCTHIYIEPKCYEKLHNDSVYVPLYNMVFDRSNYIINQELLFICPDFFPPYEHREKFSLEIPIVSLVCSSISTVCILLHIAMFAFVKKLRNLPGYCLLSLCVALFAAYLCTFVQSCVDDQAGCTVIGMFLLYFFLASFFWMNTMAYDVWKSIRMATAKLRLTTNRPIMVQFARYSLYGWGMPLIIVLSSIAIHHSASDASKYRLTFDISNCWFKYKQALTLYFAGPLFTLLALNILFFASSFYMICSASMSKSQSGTTPGNSDLWSRLFLSLRLSSVMGFMWIFGIIATVTRQEWVWYLYSVCSALQGVFIFFSFTVSARARKVCMNAIKNRKCSTVPTQTSSQQMTSSQL